MDESHDLEHEKANSQFQYNFFKEIIEQTDPNAEVRVLHTYLDDINSFSYDDYDVFMWTGGLGNIYLSEDLLFFCKRTYLARNIYCVVFRSVDQIILN